MPLTRPTKPTSKNIHTYTSIQYKHILKSLTKPVKNEYKLLKLID